MLRLALAILFLVSMSSLDALRDVGRGQFGYWPWHIIKWASFYPPLAYILYEEVWKPLHWYYLPLGNRVRIAIAGLVTFATVSCCWAAWSVFARIYRPAHWDDGPSQWLELLKGLF